MAKAAEVEDALNILPPEQRYTLIGHQQAEEKLRYYLDSDSLTNGWMICGNEGVGKATLAYRIARAVLDPESLVDDHSLAVSLESKAAHLVRHKGHPDLHIAERKFDEKKDRYDAEIKVDTIRDLNTAMNRTASGNGKRVVIVDTANHMNLSAANAFLKSLEEPPAGTLILLLVSAPGRLLPTIRSRCRMIDLHPVADELVAQFLIDEIDMPADEAARLTTIAEGRPGYALRLAAEDGALAMTLNEAFLNAVAGRGSIIAVSEKLAPKSADALWANFCMILLKSISLAARQRAAGHAQGIPAVLQSAPVENIINAWERLRDLSERGDTLNLDRTQMVLTMATMMRDSLQGK